MKCSTMRPTQFYFNVLEQFERSLCKLIFTKNTMVRNSLKAITIRSREIVGSFRQLSSNFTIIPFARLLMAPFNYENIPLI